MAVNAYLIVDQIPGPSTSKTGAIDILSFSVGATMTSTYGTGASGMESKAGRADLSNLSIMKVLDKTSTSLFKSCVSGNVIKSVILLYDKPLQGATTQADYYRIYLQDAMITSFQHSGSAENPTESLSFAYQAIEIAYKAEEDPSTLAGAIWAGFNLETLKSDYSAPDPFK
jgi:type VI secretion system secreted protein Hcp